MSGILHCRCCTTARRYEYTSTQRLNRLTCIQLIISIEINFVVSTVVTKISILLFHRRLVGVVSTQLRHYIYVAIGFVALYGVCFPVALLVGCHPFDAYWKQMDPFWAMANKGKFHCVDEASLIITSTTISIIQDFLACFLPMTFFFKLQMPLRRKVALAAIFGVGFL